MDDHWPKLNIDLSAPEALAAARSILAQHAHELLRNLCTIGESGEVAIFVHGAYIDAPSASADDCRSLLALLGPMRAAYEIRARVHLQTRAPGGQA